MDQSRDYYNQYIFATRKNFYSYSVNICAQGLNKLLASICALLPVQAFFPAGCWSVADPESCGPWSGRFSSSLMLIQVLPDWIETEVEFHAQVVLISRGESYRDLGGVC